MTNPLRRMRSAALARLGLKASAIGQIAEMIGEPKLAREIGVLQDAIATLRGRPASGPPPADTPAGRMIRLFEDRYGDVSDVVRAINAWSRVAEDWRRPYNLDMETPVTEVQVQAAEDRMLQTIRSYGVYTALRLLPVIDTTPDVASTSNHCDLATGDCMGGPACALQVDGQVPAPTSPRAPCCAAQARLAPGGLVVISPEEYECLRQIQQYARVGADPQRRGLDTQLARLDQIDRDKLACPAE